MKIAILSDIHDNLWNLAAVMPVMRTADVLLCCGDLCSPFVVDELGKFNGSINIVFGNNDADLYRITAKALKKPNCQVHGELYQATLDGKRIAMNHFDYLARPMSKSGDYDVVCFGHNHEFEISRQHTTLLINPGPIMGAKFSSGKWEDAAATFVLYDTAADAVEAFAVDRETKSVTRFEPSIVQNLPGSPAA
ncbi:MAG TPA: metallophosphoesterase family protein [Bryobacteraceae bacterium]|nr:metallophosphoesterase family protein [Bryobacteraceae bacterium]